MTITTIILYTATMSTATKKRSTGSTPFSTAADLLDDRPRVSELKDFYELLIKGQLEEYLSQHDTEAIRKIRDAANDHDEGISLLERTFEEDPTLLHKLREAIGKVKGILIAHIVPRRFN